MTLEELLAQFQIGQPDKKAALNQALAAAGFQLMGARKGREWEAAGNAGLTGMGVYNSNLAGAQQGKLDQFKLREMAQKYLDAQNAQKEQAALAEQLGQVFSGAPQLQNMGQGGPTPANAQAAAPKSRAEQYREAATILAARGQVEQAKKYADIAAILEDEYGQPQIGVGPDGKPTFAQFGKRGGVKTAEGVAPPPKFREVNRGGQVDILNEYNIPGAGTSLPTTMTPFQSQSLDLDRAKFGYQKSQDAKAGAGGAKAPEGYRWTADGKALEPIPGGPKDTSAAKEASKAKGLSQANIVLSKVEEAEKLTGPTTTGYIGARLAKIEGSDAYNLRQAADTIKANLSFEELRAMKAASPTGGALGAISQRELELLGNTVASIDPNQSEAQLRKNLAQVKKHMTAWKAAVDKANSGGDGWTVVEEK